MKRLALLAFIPLTLAAVQDDGELQRTAKLKAIEDWLGKWKIELELTDGPPEIKGLTIQGELNVKWDLDHTALRFEGWGKADPKFVRGEAKRVEFSGWLTYNHVGVYEERGYSATFAWSSDARLLLARGEFKGKDLLMELSTHPSSNVKLQAHVVGKHPRRVIVRLAGPQGAKREEWLRITLRRP
ncbi:MAG: hypothetical protein HONBIEJF_02704 [Fimbriimonadaceae bacterium]|nr:hypothetical protein [Fimbriimonadaceae bacterium]